MVPSPKVATYDKQPEMSAQAVADKVAEVIKTNEYEFVMCNFAPPDMVCLWRVVCRIARAYPRQTCADMSRLATLVSTMRPSRRSRPPTLPSRPFTTRVRRPVTCLPSLPTTATLSRCSTPRLATPTLPTPPVSFFVFVAWPVVYRADSLSPQTPSPSSLPVRRRLSRLTSRTALWRMWLPPSSPLWAFPRRTVRPNAKTSWGRSLLTFRRDDRQVARQVDETHLAKWEYDI